MIRSTEQGNLYTGTFNAEYFWKGDDQVCLPALNSEQQINNVIYAMDDLLIFFCSNPSDTLFSMFPVSNEFIGYIENFGLKFQNPDYAKEHPVCMDSHKFESIASTILRSKEVNSRFLKQARNRVIKPYAIDHSFLKIASQTNAFNEYASFETIKKVNSKIYSTDLTNNLLRTDHSASFFSVDTLNMYCCDLLSNGYTLLIKEEFGVSGKGSLHIQSDKELMTIVKYLKKQENTGKKVRLIVEKFLAKEFDFSFHINIRGDGSYQYLGIQEMKNSDLSFNRIGNPSEVLMSKLTEQNYFIPLENVVGNLVKDGYFGPVCIDSMVLSNGVVIPIVEINARISMGLINLAITKHLEQWGTSGILLHHTLIVPKNIEFSFEIFCDLLKRNALLFSRNCPVGYLILSYNTLFVNAQLADIDQYKGRLYSSLIGVSEDESSLYENKLKMLLKGLGIKVL